MSHTSEEFEVVSFDINFAHEADEDRDSSTLLDFVDVLPRTKLTDAHKETLKSFLLQQELTLDDFMTVLSDESVRQILLMAHPLLPLGPLHRFIDAIFDYRRAHAGSLTLLHQSTSEPWDAKLHWSMEQVFGWIAKEFPTFTPEVMHRLQATIQENNITGEDLFHPDGKKSFKENQGIPLGVRNTFAQLAEVYETRLNGVAALPCPNLAHEEKETVVQESALPALSSRYWYWFNDKHGFIRFETATCKQINAALGAGMRRVVLSKGKFFGKTPLGRYELIFDNVHPEGPHAQRNTNSEERRAVISHRHEFVCSGKHKPLVRNVPRYK